MEFLYDYGLFLAKAVTIVLAIGSVIVLIAATAIKQKGKKGELSVTNLSEQYADIEHELNVHLLSKAEWKEKEKQEKKAKKDDKHADASSQAKLYVLDFKGSIDAREVDSLREEVSAILTVASDKDEVLLRLESGGGMVHGYGLAASQLDRVKQRQIPLTVAVDKVAASGGYLMACVANKILAAPFSIIGSIGVIAQLPNFNKVLKKHDIEFEQLTAGEYKRTLTIFGENTDKGREKFQQELEETHQLFKQYVADHRPSLNIAEVATGEHWFGTQAKKLGLIDEITTSDDYLQALHKDKLILKVKYEVKKGLADKLSHAASLATHAVIDKLMQRNRPFAE